MEDFSFPDLPEKIELDLRLLREEGMGAVPASYWNPREAVRERVVSYGGGMDDWMVVESRRDVEGAGGGVGVVYDGGGGEERVSGMAVSVEAGSWSPMLECEALLGKIRPNRI